MVFASHKIIFTLLAIGIIVIIVMLRRHRVIYENFQSPKSDIQNFNETTNITDPINNLKPYNSQMTDLVQPKPKWVYPYTYINRHFDVILYTISHQIEKDYNNNRRLRDGNSQIWSTQYPYTTSSYDQLTDQIRNLLTFIIDEINGRFNVAVPIVGIRHNQIQYYWINGDTVILKIKVYKKHTYDDIKYFDEHDPSVNAHLRMDFEREMIVVFNRVTNHSHHIEYVRFTSIDYDHNDTYDDMRYVNEFDTNFYLAKSYDPNYRIMSNTEARDQYIKYVDQKNEESKYRCIIPYSYQTPPNDQTQCLNHHGLWEKKCETDQECPYYKSNTNYPNNFGQCDKTTGYCQMPIGINNLSYHVGTDVDNAICYNCPKGFTGPMTMGQCCKTMSVPDYMFDNDEQVRYQNKEILKQNGLNWFK